MIYNYNFEVGCYQNHSYCISKNQQCPFQKFCCDKVFLNLLTSNMNSLNMQGRFKILFQFWVVLSQVWWCWWCRRSTKVVSSGTNQKWSGGRKKIRRGETYYHCHTSLGVATTVLPHLKDGRKNVAHYPCLQGRKGTCLSIAYIFQKKRCFHYLHLSDEASHHEEGEKSKKS